MKRHAVQARLAVAAVLTAAMVAAVALLPTPERVKADFSLEQVVPASFGPWRLDAGVVPVSPSPDVEANLSRIYEQLLARTYVDDRGRRMMLTIAYGGDQRDALQAHLQEVCYRAQGFKVEGLEESRLTVLGGDLPVIRMFATQGARSEPVTYWLTMGDSVVRHRGQRLVQQVLFSLRHGKVPDGLLVRVSSLDADREQAYAAQGAFIDALMAAMPQRNARRLLGREV